MAKAKRVKPYIGYIAISPAMAAKIFAKHRVTADEIRGACQWPARYAKAEWHYHEEYGLRLLVKTRTAAGTPLRVILQPVRPQEGTWRLRTALVVTKGRRA